MPRSRDEYNWTESDVEKLEKEISKLQEAASAASVHSSDPKVRQRLDRVEVVLRVAAFLTRVEPNDPVTAEPEKYIRGKLGHAVWHFGLDVVKREV